MWAGIILLKDPNIVLLHERHNYWLDNFVAVSLRC
jgi:hypothetical protein